MNGQANGVSYVSKLSCRVVKHVNLLWFMGKWQMLLQVRNLLGGAAIG